MNQGINEAKNRGINDSSNPEMHESTGRGNRGIQDQQIQELKNQATTEPKGQSIK